MLAVSAAELAAIRAETAAAVLDLPCLIQRKTITRDSAGTATEIYATIATVNAGMTQPTAGQLQNYDYVIGSLASWQVQLPYGTDVKAQDHLVIGTDTLVVQVVLTPRSYSAVETVLASEKK